MRSITSRATRLTAVLAVVLVAAAVAAPAGAQSVSFARFYAIGDSLAAGFINGGLAIHPQERSVPALVARQAGVTDFEQPLISMPGIPPLLAIQGFSNGIPIIVPRSNQPGAPLNLNLPRPYNNMAVPGFDVEDVFRTFTGNALIDIILRGQGDAINQALSQDPTFMLFWIGNNDVLGAATSGIVIEGVTLTPVETFRDFYRSFSSMTGASRRAVFATLPDVTTIPFVTTVPSVVVNPATRQPVLGPGGQPIPLIGPEGPLTPNDRVLLTATPLLAQGIGLPSAVGGTNQPLPDNVVLSAAEVATIRARVAAFNQIIRETASERGNVVADIHALLERAATTGVPVGGNIVLTTDFLTGGIFSYDGVHPTPLGNAVAANEFIRAINGLGAGLQPVDLTPFLFGPDGSAGATIELPGLGEGTPIFSAAAYEALRLSLRVPPTEELLRIKERRRDPGPGPAPGPTPRLDGGGLDGPVRSVTSRPR